VNETNWAGNYRYEAKQIHRPQSLGELQDVVVAADRIRLLGSLHSFTDIVDAAELLSLASMPSAIEVDGKAMTVKVPGQFTYAAVCDALRPVGLALHNLASLPHISVAGAIATGTHGSGDGNGNLATAVLAMTLMTADGETVTFDRSHADFAGAVVSLGALGVVLDVTLAVQPSFDIVQQVFEHLPWEAAIDATDDVFGAGYSVSLFTTYGSAVEQVWLKRLADSADPAEQIFPGTTPATEALHMVAGESSVNCTPQLGARSLWSDALPHFRADFAPSVGNEVQSEWFVSREHAGAAMHALRGCRSAIAPALMVSEIRTVAGDELWMSPHYHRDSVAFHFTWFHDDTAIGKAVDAIEAALAPYDARPHWGKVFGSSTGVAGDRYAKRDEFVSLADRLDPDHTFRNDWFNRTITR